MAHLAILRESRLHMVGAGGLVVIGHVATRALDRHCREVVVHVAQQAYGGHVRTSQREGRLIVIEIGRLPCRGGVTRIASLREARLHVARIRCLGEVRHVAARALQGRSGELVVDMALRADKRDVRARQGELGGGVVIEFRAIPVGGRVTQ